MIVDERSYYFHPGKHLEYLKLYETEGMAIQMPILERCVGYFTVEVGELNCVVHMWAYDDLADFERRRGRLAADPKWQQYVPKIRPLMLRQETRLLKPTAWSPIR